MPASEMNSRDYAHCGRQKVPAPPKDLFTNPWNLRMLWEGKSKVVDGIKDTT